MIKLKCLKATTAATLEEITLRFKDASFSEDTKSSIELIETKHNYCRSKYREKITKTEVISNQYGETKEISFTSFIIFDFLIHNISTGKFIITIENPPKSLKSFIAFLSSIMNNNLYFQNMRVNISKFITFAHEHHSIEEFKINFASTSAFVLNKNSSGSISIKSSKNALQELSDLVGNSNFVTNKIGATVKTKFNSGTITISNTSLFHLSDDLYPEVFNFIIETLSTKTNVDSDKR